MGVYFVYKGKKYGVGTVVKTRPEMAAYTHWRDVLKFVGPSRSFEDRLFFGELQKWYCGCHIPENEIELYIEEILEAHPIDPPPKKQKPMYIEGEFEAWIWYILLMLIGTIFKGNVLWWIFITYVFWDWRQGKIKRR